LIRFGMKDEYTTIVNPVTGEFKDRGSKFIAYAFPVYTQEDIQKAQEQVRTEHIKARHHCFGWRLGTDGNQYRANDDGEPSGTAGKPILGQLDKQGLTNVMVIVVRYFGGTLLGASGLINAYRNSTAIALETAERVTKLVEDVYEIEFDYSIMSNVMNSLKKYSINVLNQEFAEVPMIRIAIRKNEVKATLLKLKASIGGLRLEEIEEKTIIAGLKLRFSHTT
jgi:uncharacterized YigZ family protein